MSPLSRVTGYSVRSRQIEGVLSLPRKLSLRLAPVSVARAMGRSLRLVLTDAAKTFEIVAYLQQKEGVRFKVRFSRAVA
jgi:hypothetical protein